MTERQARKDLCRSLANYKPSRYSRAYSLYQRQILPKVDPILRAIALPSPLAPRLPVYKTLRAAARMLMLNEFQLTLMSVLIKESGWKMDGKIFEQYQEGVGELLCFPCENNDYRRLTLYLLLVGWAAKSSLNEDCQDLLHEVRRVCFNFKSIFQQWVVGHTSAFTLHPAALNRLYYFYSSSLTASITDYQLLVDTIIQLSQAYSSEKDQPPIPSRSPIVRPSLSREPGTNTQGPIARFALVELPTVGAEVVKEEFEMNVFGNRDLSQSVLFPGIFASSMGGIFGLGSVIASKRSEQEYYQIELGEGDNNFMVFSHGGPTLSSVFGLQRAVSHTEHFLLQSKEARSDC